ncbi:hypothetical protein QF028_005940 [Neobacillus sp. B4I6]|uniref:hypothetical protein n=1 Tax=Neobacillus sp. B4I6 TaxID=3373925 RepID=UPI003D1E874F
MISIKRIDITLLYIILANVFFFRYFEVLYTPFYMFDLFILLYMGLRLLSAKKNVSKNSSYAVFLSSVFLVIVLGMNASQHGFNRTFINSLLTTFSPATYLLFLLFLRKQYSYDSLKDVAFKLRNFLNVYFVVNTIIVIIQIYTGNFMMSNFLSFNPNAFDHYSGLVGLNGVSVLNFIWITTLLFNLYFYIERKRFSTLLLLMIQFVTMATIQQYNDMKMFFMTVVLFLLIFLIISMDGVKILKPRYKKKTILRFFIALYTLPVIAICVYLTSDMANEYEKSSDLVAEFFQHGSSIPSVYNERAYLNYEALNLFNGKGTGIGLANIDIAHQNIHEHLTINSSSLTIMQGGIIYLLAVINFYSVLVLRLFSGMNNFNKAKIYFIVFASFLVSSYATEVFRDHYIFLTYTLIYFSLFLAVKSKVYNNKFKTNSIVTELSIAS